jgi:hypothetical protein
MPEQDFNSLGAQDTDYRRNDRRAGWQIKKEVNISFLAAAAFQLAVGVWWAKGVDERLNFLERTTTSAESFARMDEKMTSMKEDLAEVKENIRRLAVRTKP